MKTRRLLSMVVFIGLALLALSALGTLVRVWAGERAAPQDGTVRVTGEYTAEGVYPDDVAVVAGSILFPPGSVVNGDAALIGTNITLSGAIGGDLTAIGETVLIAPGAAIAGDTAINGRTVQVSGAIAGDLLVTAEKLVISPDAHISGQIYPCVAASGLTIAGDHAIASCNAAQQAGLFEDAQEQMQPTGVADGSIWARLAGAVLLWAVLAGLSVLAVIFIPDRLHLIEQAVRERTQDSFAAFAAALCVAVGVAALLALLLALITPVGLAVLPLAALLSVGFVVLIATGLVVAAVRVGRALTDRFAPVQPPLVSALTGSAVIGLIFVFAAFVPSLEIAFIAALIFIAAAGTGAAILTRFGARPLRRAYFVQG